jgi:hypothetical protein
VDEQSPDDTSATARLPDGDLFGRHRIVRLIAEGGMGVVYEAVHPDLKKRVALKTLLPVYCKNEEARSRFLREAEAAARIDHPNVVTVSDVGVEKGLPYMVMELLEGQTLGTLLAERGALDVATALALLLPAMAAVAAGHSRGVIHRDLTPQNIFLATGRRQQGVVPKVLDFGVSKLMADDGPILTKTFTVLGTAAYMSPEQARGARHVDFKSDQYSLGLILYEILAGQRARPGDSALEVLHVAASGFVPALPEVRPDRSRGIETVLARMLAPRPADRYASVGEAARALLPFADEATRLSLGSEFRAAEAPAPERGAGGAAETGTEGGLSGSGELPEVLSGRMGGTRLLPVASWDPLPGTIRIPAAAPPANARTAKVRRPSTRTALVALGTSVTVVACGVLLGMLGRSEPSAAARDAAPDRWRASMPPPLPAPGSAPTGVRSAPSDRPLAPAPRPASEVRVEHPRGDAEPSTAGDVVRPAHARALALAAAAKPPVAVKAVSHRVTKRPASPRTPARVTVGAVPSDVPAPVRRGTNNALIITN